MTYVLGVDFGTTFSAAAVAPPPDPAGAGPEGPVTGPARVFTLGNRSGAVPSALLVRADGSFLCGEDAYHRGASEPGRLVRNLKLRLGDGGAISVGDRTYTAEELVAAFLAWVLERVAGGEGGPPARLVLTHPANWRSRRLEAFRRAAARAAGPLDIRFATEPHAAGVFQSTSFALRPGDLVAAYDLGGGTFDAAVLRRGPGADGTDFEVIGEPEGVEHLGGVDFDDALFHLVRTKLGDTWEAAERRGGASFQVARAGLLRECTAAKESLSSELEVDVPVVLPGVTAPVRVRRAELEQLVRPSLEETVGAFRRALRSAGVRPEDLSAVLLVGGSTRMPLVRQLVAAAVGPGPTLLDADPKHAVARGAALLARAGAGRSAAGPPERTVGGLTPEPGGGAVGLVAAGGRGAGPGAGGAGGAGAASGEAAARGAAAPGAPVGAPAGGAAPGAAPGAAAAVTAGLQPVGGPGGRGAAAETAGPDRVGGPDAGATGGGSEGALGGRSGSPPPAPAGGGEAPSRRRRAPLLVGAAVLVVVALAAVYLVSSGDDGGDVSLGSAEATEEGAAGPTSVAAAAGNDGGDGGGSGGSDVAQAASPERMVAVPAGAYPLGSAQPGPEAAGARTVTLGAYHIDVHEVTNADYDKFVQQLGAAPARSWPRGQMPDEKATHPVTGVEWAWAQAYCQALGKRLPREAEWEAAARGAQGLPFPWGQDAAAVDLDTPGSRPVGSVAANVSPLGVRDTVGSAWEWVDEPYEPVSGSQKVRRGGENGRVRGGAAMRQVVDQANESTIRETGFRCAADRVDPAVPFGQFVQEHTQPETATTRPGPATSAPAGAGTLVDDRFEDPRSGWAERTDGLSKLGYHAPTSYHVEPASAGVGVVALGGYSYADGVVETAAYVDKTASPTGRFRYGLVFRAHGARRAPLSMPGPDRPESFYAFVIDPRGGVWELLHEDIYPLRRLAGGPLPAGIKMSDAAQPDVFRAELRGSAITMFLNGAPVGSFDTRGYHLEGDLGLYVEALDEPKPHVHFDRFTVTPV